MYGWLEAGGATSLTSFNNTDNYDVVLRTSYTNNKLVFGNSNNTTAGMYIVGNNVGISKVPSHSLDVHGDIVGDHRLLLTTNPSCNLATSNIDYNIEMTSSNIRFFAQTNKINNSNVSNTMVLSSFGVLQNRMLVSNTIRTMGPMLSNVYIEEVYPNENDDHVETGYTFITDALYKDYFSPSNTFLVGDVFFNVVNRIVNTSSNLIVNVTLPFPEQNAVQFPFETGEIIDIQLLRNINPLDDLPQSLIVSDYVHHNVSVTSYAYNIDSSVITLSLTVNDYNERFFKLGTYYHYKTIKNEETMGVHPDNILYLSDFSNIVQVGDVTNMNVSFRMPVENDSIQLYMLSLISRFQYTNSVSAVFFSLDIPLRSGIDLPIPLNIYVGGGVNVTDQQHVQYNVSSSDDMLLNTLLSAQYKSNYLGKYVYIKDDAPESSRIWVIDDYIPTSKTNGTLFLSCEDVIDVVQYPLLNHARTLQVLLFRYPRFTIIGDHINTTYVPIYTKVGVGTFNVGETLTVGGTLSAREDMYIYSDTCAFGFKVSYTSNVLNLDNSVHIDNRESTQFNLQVSSCSKFMNDVVVSKEDNHLVFVDGNYIAGQYQGSSNNLIDTFGSIKTALVDADDVKAVKEVFAQTVIRAFELGQTFQDAEHAWHSGVVITIASSFTGKLRTGDVLRFNRTLFKLVRYDIDPSELNKTLRMSMEWYFEQEREYYESLNALPFNVGESVSIEVLRDDLWQNTKTARVPLLVSQFEYIQDGLGKNTQLTVRGVIVNSSISTTLDSVFLSVGRFFNIRGVGAISSPDEDIDNVVLLKGVSSLGDNEYRLQFKAIDNITGLDETTVGLVTSAITPGTSNAYMYIYPLDSFFQPNRMQYPHDIHPLTEYPYPQFTDSNVTLGFAAEHNNITYLVIRNASTLQSYFSPSARFVSSPIDRLYFDNSMYEIGGLFMFQNHLLACAKSVNPNILTPYANTTVTYALNGIPLQVVSAVFPSDNSFTMVTKVANVDDLTRRLLRLYVTHNIFIMDKYNIVWHFSDMYENDDTTISLTLLNKSPNATQFTFTDFADLAQPRYIFVIPLKYFSFNVLGSSRYDNYIENKVGVGTHFIKEYLTVAGDASIYDSFVINSGTSTTPFHMTYCNDRFEWRNPSGLVWQVTTSNINVFGLDMDLSGFISARNFYTHSDQRLKKNITKSDPYNDLTTINKMNICEFDFVDTSEMRGGRTQKGVIAQELEKLLPSLVSEKEGWLPNVYKDGFTDVTGSIINLEGVSFDIVKGNILKVIILGSQSLSVKIKNVNLNIEKNTTDIEVEDKLQPLSDVFVYGSLDSYKMVDNTYLFMTSINAIKALASEIEHIKERLKTAGL
jgi:hypothetical protein